MCSGQHQRQRPLSLISTPRQNINQNGQYGNNVTLNIEKTNAYLSSRIDTVHKNWTLNMFTYISEQRPSMQIQLCPIFNLRLKSYDFRDAEWIPESSHDNEFTMPFSHKTRGLMNKLKTAVKSLHGLVSVIIKAKKHCYIKYNLFVLRVSLWVRGCHVLKYARWCRS